MTEEVMDTSTLVLDKSIVADLIVDLWRIHKRAKRDHTSESVHIACERAIERTEALGFRIQEMVGEPYHENMRVRVVHHEGGNADLHISECLSPAIYFTGKQASSTELLKSAEVVINGR